jgi:hypothetical protein
MAAMQMNTRRVLLLVAYYVVSFGVVNLSFPIRDYFTNFTYPKSYVLSSFMLLCLLVTLITALASPVLSQTKKPLWGRVTLATFLQFILVAALAVACSGLGFGWSVGGFSALTRLSFFFAEFEFLRFIVEAAIPLAACAAFAYYLLGRTRSLAG